MSLKKSLHIAVLFVVLVIFSSPAKAQSKVILAYIDPGTGSLLLQILLACLVGIGFAIKIFWATIKSFLVKLFVKERNQDTKDLNPITNKQDDSNE